MRRSVRSLAFLLPVVFAWAALAQLGVDCPSCHYKFDGPVPPPRVGGVATGSGFVVHPDGYILTNYHVIEGSQSIKVKVAGQEYTATVLDSLPAQDLALLKIDARGLPVAVLGNSDLLQVGDDVFAIGCPGGVCGTVTAGRVANSGVTITVEGGKELRGMLMVDITIDHGSSGGPLVNSRGEVVGVTTAGKQGSFGFAVPINQAIPLLRRVPGFDPRQMGKATAELPFRQIRDRMTPVTAFVITDQGKALELPPRYDTTKWPNYRGFTCPSIWDPSSSSDCYLDRHVPPGLHLVGYIEGVADEEGWRRDRLPPFTEKPVWFGRKCGVWVMQFGTSAEAQQAARALCCQERVWSTLTRDWSCSTCLKERTVISSTRVSIKGGEVTREVTAHWEILICHHEYLTYKMVATLQTYVIVLVAQAWLACEDFMAAIDMRADDQGLRFERSVLFGSAPPPYVVMTYDGFMKWATDRDKELLEFILAQF